MSASRCGWPAATPGESTAAAGSAPRKPENVRSSATAWRPWTRGRRRESGGDERARRVRPAHALQALAPVLDGPPEGRCPRLSGLPPRGLCPLLRQTEGSPMRVMPANHASAHRLAQQYGRELLGHLYSPSGVRDPKGLACALDNDRFGAWAKGHPWQESAFFGMCDRVAAMGVTPLWVLVPDVVASR